MLGELREMARAPVAIFEGFLAELRRITADKTMAAANGIERVKGLQATAVREMEESLRRFRIQVGEAEAVRLELLRPPRRDLYEEIKRATRQLMHLIGLAARREKLLRTWEDQTADALVQGYRAALERHELEAAEVYEAEAERVLRRKGNAAALQAFLDLRAKAEEERLTPFQKQAKAGLEEIERLKREVTLATQVIASTLKVAGNIAVGGAGWRKANRLCLGPEIRGQTRVLVFPGSHPGMTACLVDVSRAGLRVTLPEKLAPGATLDLVVQYAQGGEGEVRIQGEVRWCQPDVTTPGRSLVGVRVLSQTRGQWLAMLNRFAELQQRGRAALEAGAS